MSSKGDSAYHRSPNGRARARARARHVSLQPVTTTGGYPGNLKFRRNVTIGKLSVKVLLNIFRYYLDASPHLWPRLVHICRRWRRIVFESRQALHLQLYCTHGTPVLQTLRYWPALPIVVQYGGSAALDPPAPIEEDDIVATLKESGRVSSISLTITRSLLEKFSAIEEPFSRLEDLVLLSRDGDLLALPSTFRWGPHLRSLHLTRITVPSLPQLLHSSRNLVDLQLHEVLNTFRISPASLVNNLSGMTRLQSLSLHFLSAADHTSFHSPSVERIILPALTHLDLRGINTYSGDCVARIDAPRLGDIEITFLHEGISDLSKLREFIDRIEMQKSHRQADILSSERAISVSLTQPGAPTCLKLQVFCKTSRLQPSIMARICSYFSAFLCRVEDLRINTMRPSSGQDSSNRGHWLGLIRQFGGTKRGPHLRGLHLTGFVFPALLRGISSSRELVNIQLHHHEISRTGLSPEVFVDALSGIPQLQSLSLHFPSTAIYTAVPPPYGGRVTLPALTRLNFRGITRYLEDFVTRIDAPRLGEIEITFSDDLLECNVPHLGEFIDRIEMQKLHREANILYSDRALSISFTQPGAPTCLKLQVFREKFRSQPFFMAQICRQISAFLVRVEDLRISTMRPSTEQDGTNREQWLGLICWFRSTKWFHVAGDHSIDIVRALQLTDERWETVLPALHKLCIREPEPRYMPLREAVIRFMRSRWFTGRFIAVEYERPRINELRGTGPFCHQATMEMLSDDVLLNIFLHFLDGSSESWPTLTHVSLRWRQIIFTSPRSLDLQLHCTYGTPVLKNLDCWPRLPLTVNYGGSPMFDPPTPVEEDNIMAALKQSNRVSSISLTVTSSLLEQLSTIPEPFSELEKLILLSRDNMQLTLPSAFRWGPRLRSLHSTRIAFPSFLQLLLPSREIVDLQLHEVPIAGYFSPEEFTNALSGMTRLRKLSLHFLSLPPRRNYLNLPPPPGERVVLPALTCLNYRGTSKYLDSLVARIDAPGLGDIDITFFSQPTMDTSQFGRFIDRIDILKPNSQAKIQISKHAISICFTQPRAPTRVELRISCEHLDWQLSSMAQICDQFSPFLSDAEDLRIETTEPSTRQDDTGSEQWLELIRSFGGAKDFRVAGDSELATVILRALCQADEEHAAVLPALRDLRVPELRSAYGPLWEAAKSFIASRWPSGSSVHVSPPLAIFPVLYRDERQYFCTFCNYSFLRRQDLSQHNSYKHMPRIVSRVAGPE